MSLEKWALIAEIVGGLAIVLSLIFVGIEVRQTRESQVQTGTQAIISEYNASIRGIATNPDLACIYARGVQDYLALSALERLRLSAFLVSVLNAEQQIFGLFRQGAVDPEAWRGFDAQMGELLRLPGVQQWYATREHWYGPAFREYVESIHDAPPSSTPVIYEVSCQVDGG